MKVIKQVEVGARQMLFEASETRYKISVVSGGVVMIVMAVNEANEPYWVANFTADWLDDSAWRVGHIAGMLGRTAVGKEDFRSTLDLQNIARAIYKELGPGSGVLYKVQYMAYDEEGIPFSFTNYVKDVDMEDALHSIAEDGGRDVITREVIL